MAVGDCREATQSVTRAEETLHRHLGSSRFYRYPNKGGQQRPTLHGLRLTLIKVPSLTFGEVEIDETTIFEFERGLPGLAGLKRFAVLESEETEPFRWLQSIDPPHLCLMMIEPSHIKPDYHVKLNKHSNPELGPINPEQVLIMVLVVVPEDPTQMTANLLAPIIFNLETRKGTQAVIDGKPEMLRVKVIQS